MKYHATYTQAIRPCRNQTNMHVHWVNSYNYQTKMHYEKIYSAICILHACVIMLLGSTIVILQVATLFRQCSRLQLYNIYYMLKLCIWWWLWTYAADARAGDSVHASIAQFPAETTKVSPYIYIRVKGGNCQEEIEFAIITYNPLIIINIK